jgi:hypothetical protein
LGFLWTKLRKNPKFRSLSKRPDSSLQSLNKSVGEIGFPETGQTRSTWYACPTLLLEARLDFAKALAVLRIHFKISAQWMND